MFGSRPFLGLLILLFVFAFAVEARTTDEERLIGWKGEVHRKGEGKQLRGGGVPKVKAGVAPKRRRWVEQIAIRPRCVHTYCMQIGGDAFCSPFAS